MTILDVKYGSDYKLILKFDNGKERHVDITPFLKGALFQSLKDVEFFRQVRVDKESGTIVWPNGADLDPDVLYDNSQPIATPLRDPEDFFDDWNESGVDDAYTKTW